jgi:ABC-type nitrate/sulfonate/bicarbonate transport system permease component
VFVLAVLLAWQLLVTNGVVDTPSVPAVSEIFAVWVDLLTSGQLLTDLWASLLRVFIGFGIASVVGTVLGIAMGYSRLAFNLLEPLTELLRPIPSPAYVPLAILFLGLGEEMKIFVIAFSCTFPILLNTFSAVRSVDPVLVNTGRTFGASRRQQIWKIYLPSALPGIMTGLRVALGIGLILVVIAEMVASSNGIGYFILNAQRLFMVPEMFAGIATLAITGYILNQVFITAERRLLRWQPRV